jgi:trigger factor
MKVTQEKLPDSQIGLEIEISGENTRKVYDKVVQNLAKSVNIPGFRKGKVPRQVLLQKLGSDRIKATVLEELIQDSVREAVEQESIDSLGNYRLKTDFEQLVKDYTPGEVFSFKASVDVPPTVELGDYQNLSVKAEETVYDPSQVEQVLKERQERHATLIPVENRLAQIGDIAVVDYSGRFADGEPDSLPITGTVAENYSMEMVEGKFVDGLVEGMVGMSPNETRNITVTFPEDYPRQDLASKQVTFAVSLKELKEKELPELDDEFAEDASEFDTIAAWREALEAQYQKSATEETKNSIHGAIINSLVEQSSVDIPDSLIQEEITQILTQSAVQLQRMGVDIREMFTQENIPGMRERAKPEAVERLKQSLVLAEVAKKESITVEDEAVETKVKEIIEGSAESDFDLKRLRDMVKADLVAEKTLNWLQEKVTVELVAKGSLTPENPEDSEISEISEDSEDSETD